MTSEEIKGTAKVLCLQIRGLRAMAEEALDKQEEIDDAAEPFTGYGEEWSQLTQQIKELKAVEAYLSDLGY